MGNDDYLTDDYVADLLAKDAKDCSLKFSTMGMEAFTSSSKKPVNAPKPNTRFLRHIIKDTDTHNKRLLDKEEAESKARLQDLERSEEAKRLKTNPNTGDIRRRQMGDIHAILGGKRPRKSRGGSDSKSKPETSGLRLRPNRDDRTPKKGVNNDLFASRDRRSQHGRLAAEDHRDSNSKPPRHRSRRHSDSEDGDEDRSSSRRHRRSDKDRSRSPRRRGRSRSPDRKSRKHRDRSPVRSKHTPPTTSAAADEDSDPLDSIIGPQPAPQPRGRGALAGTSGIDRRFSETYDPTQDVSMEDHAPEGGDWDDEVEAFRDRQKLKQAQERRLRLAGFNDEDINRTTSGGESAEDNVQWSKVGEKREWDMGKAT